MPDRTHSHKSPRIPRLELLTRERTDPVPDMHKGTELKVGALGLVAYRLFQARRRIKRDKQLGDEMRDKILNTVPDGLYGFRIRGKRVVKVILARSLLKTIKDNPTFFDYLGDHADTVVKGIKIVPGSTRVDYGTVILMMENLIQERFGAKVVPQIDTGELNRLIAAGELEPADEFFEEGEGPVRVLVDVSPKT